MIPIVVCSIYMWYLIVERLLVYRGLKEHEMTIHEAVGIVSGREATVEGYGLRNLLMQDFMEDRSGIPDVDIDVLRQSGMRIELGLNRNLASIAVLAAVAPLLGLLGTVLGMIETFDVISFFGTGNAKAMANGISVALVTTQTGLLVAIPGLFMSGMLRRQSNRLKIQLKEDTSILSRAIRDLMNGKAGRYAERS